MTNTNILFIGMDVHKESIEIAITDGANQEVRRYAKIGGARSQNPSSMFMISLGVNLWVSMISEKL